ncbi:hypothetical protein ACFSVM_23545 [Paenibacillus shunpengii]|uniref:BclA C-terminal domain-containing protein n=1 Tax=Paenibacillus shunpengii TaxID=2054424 RepID=A0ABW5SVU2_9BACL
MTNYSVFNTANKPIYVQQTNTYVSPAIESMPDLSAASAGRLFTLTTGNVSAGGGANLLLQVVNPAASSRTLYLSQIIGGSTAAASLIVYNGGILTGGTTPVPVNNNFGSSVTSAVTTQQVTGTVTGSPVTLMNIPLTAGAYNIQLRGSVIIPPGRSVTISIGPGSLTGSINLTWWEV